MRSATRIITKEDHQRINNAVAQAEARTAAEIVPIVATRSGRYDRAEDLCGFACALGAFTLVWLLFQREDPTAGGWDGLPLTLQLPVLVAILAIGYVLGALLASRSAFITRSFTPRSHMIEEALGAASQLFFDHRIRHTDARTGVLIYISLLERQAVIHADQAAYEALGPEASASLCADLTSRLHTENIVNALTETISEMTEPLAVKLPREIDNRNELANALIVM